MAGFNFEKNLPHQAHAVEATVGVFEGMNIVFEYFIKAKNICS